MKRGHQVISAMFVVAVSLSAISGFAAETKPDAKTSAQEAFTWLKNGNERFMNDNRERNLSKKFRSDFANGEAPHSVVLSSSDSRVVPEFIFDQGFGQLYSVRTTGLVLDSSSIASIEHAVAHLGTKLIVVMGNDNCEAVRAAYDVPANKSAGSAHLDKIISFIRPGVEKFRKVSESDRTLHAAVKANVFAVSKHLVKESKIIFDKIKKSEVMLVQAVYNMNSGKVEFSEDVGPILAQMIQSEKSPARNVSSESEKPEKKEKKKSKKKDDAVKKDESKKEDKKEEKKSDKKEDKKEDKKPKEEEKKDTSGSNSWGSNKKDSY